MLRNMLFGAVSAVALISSAHAGMPRTHGVTNTSPTTSYDRSGGFGGGQLGYNFQRDRFVFGVETDIQGADITGSGSANRGADLHSTGYDVVANARREATLDWFGTVRGRLGYSFYSALIYFTGGFA